MVKIELKLNIDKIILKFFFLRQAQ